MIIYINKYIEPRISFPIIYIYIYTDIYIYINICTSSIGPEIKNLQSVPDLHTTSSLSITIVSAINVYIFKYLI